MVFLLTFHWGWLSVRRCWVLQWAGSRWFIADRGVSKRTSRWLSLLALVLIVAALARVVPGRAGYWLDLALMMFALISWVARSDPGCAIGWSRAARGRLDFSAAKTG